MAWITDHWVWLDSLKEIERMVARLRAASEGAFHSNFWVERFFGGWMTTGLLIRRSGLDYGFD